MSGIGTSHLAAACQTDAGRVRANNEDLFVCEPERGIFAVIDGVGGQSAGEVAAAVARRVMLDRLARPLGTPADRVREAIALANNQIFSASEHSPEYNGMTCVLTLALVVDHRMTIGHVGDSRLYKLSPAGIRKLTHDHSPVGEREDALELTEQQAMRHPRRNEVFRDVGGAHRDKDDEGFVDIVEETFEDDSAILLCTDGLTDLVPCSTIAQVVREHAGSPQAVADALVSAANDAGGGDNVTTVFVEAPGFARAVRRAWAVLPARVDPPPQPAAQRANAAADAEAGKHRGARVRVSDGVAQTWQWVTRRRSIWFAAGTLVGAAAALVFASRVGGLAAPRTLVVGSIGTFQFTSIGDAVASARAGDVVQLEPGTYEEQVLLPDGVDLIARIPGKATLRRADGADGDWRAVTAIGAGRIRGIRIASTEEAPIAVAIHISGADRRVELVDIDGSMRTGIEIADASRVTVSGCFIHTPGGTAVVIDAATDVTLANNTVVRTGGVSEPALLLKSDVWPILERNLFGGYGAEIISGVVSPDGRAHLLSGNFVIASGPTGMK